MIEYLQVDDLDSIGKALIPGFTVRDWGMLEAAVARPAASALGEDAYPTVHHKAAALLHSIVRNHALVDGNKRLGWAATLLFYGYNALWMPELEHEQYEFVVSVANGTVFDGAEMAKTLHKWTIPLD